MKYSTGTAGHLPALRYIKLFCIKSILLFLMASCEMAFNSKEITPVDDAIIGNESLSSTELLREQEEMAMNSWKPILGIDRLHLLVDSLLGKRIAVVGNQTSVVRNTHLVDSLLSLKLNVVKVFSPEHGFRGQADAGEKVNSTMDEKTGIPLISLYGNNKKPSPEQLANVDVVIYDIQDVGVRFYTYISTLHYVMEACAENGKKLIVLDRPNPNGHYIDGPVLEMPFKSFVGMHPIPIVYGMTIGELAMMVNGERWLTNGLICDLWVIPCKNYDHKYRYILPIPPSPNLRTERAISLYPSLCLFEGTTVSVGRGTECPFEVFGHPNFPNQNYSFTPRSVVGAKTPLYENTVCYGFDLKDKNGKRIYEIDLSYLIRAKNLIGDSIRFIDQPLFFDKLAGTATLREQILNGWTDKMIRESWQPELESFKALRKKYLLYP